MYFPIKKILFASILVALCLVARGQRTIELTSFEQLWGMAVKQNPTLDIYKLNIEIARYNHRASNSYLLPTIAANATAQDNFAIQTTVVNGHLLGQPDQLLFEQFGTKYTYAGALSLSYILFDWQKVVTSKQAQNNVKLQQAQEGYYLQTLKNQTALSYFQSLVSLRALEISRQDLALADTLVKIAQHKYDEGTLALIDLNQAKINYNQIVQNAIASENLYQSNIDQLRILLGSSVNDSIVLNEQLPKEVQQERYMLNENKLLDTYAYMVKDAEFSLKSQRAVNSPHLSFNAFYGFDQFQETFSAFSFKSADWHKQQYIGLSLSQPLFAGFGNSNRVRAAKKNVELARKQAEIATQQSDINDHLLLGEVERKRNSAEKALITFNLYAENLSLYNVEYREGAIDLNTFLIYFQNYLIAENAYLGQLADYYTDLSVIISRN